ncbi:helix-turn-helix domain-containing protein [Nocardia jinanensis]|uniref:Regulatory protein, IclR family n=1 Tax=Nocardia jinanensis TaxID=382504 RepID=A0A917RMA9_9NOCA|nr:helix-turn-helix domain-containing protein [Nocardia jinanensis]GGL13434.1 putative regulatory protein, IclR family [Nocardia jinanensis]
MPIKPSPAVVRAGQLLQFMARRPSASYSIAELARATDMPRATCDSTLQALAEHGLVVRRGHELRYELGGFCIVLGDAARAANPILNAASVEAEALARALNACVAVSALIGNATRVMAVSDWGPPLGTRPRPGQSVPLSPPFGAVFVAWDRDKAVAWLAEAAGTSADEAPDRWHKALDAIRRRGYSVSLTPARSWVPDPDSAFETALNPPDPEHARRYQAELAERMKHTEYLPMDLEGAEPVRLMQISAPVFDVAGRTAAALMLLGPPHELAIPEVEALGRQVADAAHRAAKAAGSDIPH